MTAPNRATLWGRVIVDELAASGVETVCLAPGSRCTPLTVAAVEHEGIETLSHLDERSAAFFALGMARRSGQPVALVCTSGTAAANFHPAVIEAFHSRVPLVVLTADRPAELHDSGANQTIDQSSLYGDSVLEARTLPEPAPEPRRLRSLRTTVCRGVATTTGSRPGPVHLNVPLAKPLEPTPVEGDVPEALAEGDPQAVRGRDGPFVRTERGDPMPSSAVVERISSALAEAEEGLLVCGPANRPAPTRKSLTALAAATGFPVLADPLSGHRFGGPVSERISGGYDGYIGNVDHWPSPDVVVRFGGSPTSKRLRHYLRDVDAHDVLVDRGGEWQDAGFTATDRIVADETAFADALVDSLGGESDDGIEGELTALFATAETRYWAAIDSMLDERRWEGAIAATVVDAMPEPATLYVSNSMPVRDVDRFVRPRETELTVLGNRGASGVDGITSSALGAAHATDEPLVLLIGDLAYYHDQNGLLAAQRCGVDATIVLVNNDGGGIFHELPIERFDPPFTEYFRTPHGLDFSATAEYYGIEFERVADRTALQEAVADSTRAEGTQVIEVDLDAEASHEERAAIDEAIATEIP